MRTSGMTYPPQGQPKEMPWETLERLDWHLWILAVLLMFVLGVSLVSFMLPSVFWFRRELAFAAPQRAFFGFCVLLALVLVYLVQRQSTVRRLKHQLFQAQAAAGAAEREATMQAFLALPSTAQLRDASAMEYRRTSTAGTHLAVALFNAHNASSEELAASLGSCASCCGKGRACTGSLRELWPRFPQ